MYALIAEGSASAAPIRAIDVARGDGFVDSFVDSGASQDCSRSASSTTGSIRSTPSTRSSRFSAPAQSANASAEFAVVAERGEPLAAAPRRAPRRRRPSPRAASSRRARCAARRAAATPTIGRSWSSTRRSTTTSERLRVAGVLLDDEQRRRLLAAAVAACGLRGGEALDQPLGEREVAVLLEGHGERVDGLLRRRGCCPAPRSRRPCGRRPSRGTPRP